LNTLRHLGEYTHPPKARKRLGRVLRGEKGITGLETAIILIAFIVVASVFAYTVLVGGIYSSQKAKESIQNGIDSISTLRVQGEPVGITNEYDNDGDGDLDNDICRSEVDWDDDATAATGTVSPDSSIYREGTYSVQIACGGTWAAANDLLASETTSVMNISTAKKVRLWIRASATCDAGDLQLVLYDAIATLDKEEQLDIPAMAADTWQHVELTLAAAADCTSIDGVGIEAEADPGTMSIWVDDVEVVPYVTQLKVTVTNGLKGWSIDVTPHFEIATGSHGELSERSTNEKSLVSLTTDNPSDSTNNTAITQCAWTVEFLGNNNGDYILDSTESAKITVWLVNYEWDSTNSMLYYSLGTGTSSRFVTSPNLTLGANTKFKLEVTPPAGATYPVERTTPATLTSVMYLRQ